MPASADGNRVTLVGWLAWLATEAMGTAARGGWLAEAAGCVRHGAGVAGASTATGVVTGASPTIRTVA